VKTAAIEFASLLAIATHAHTYAHVETPDDLPPRLDNEIEAVFANCNQKQGRLFKPINRSGPKMERASGSIKGLCLFRRANQPILRGRRRKQET
jgi:hypothetical protein